MNAYPIGNDLTVKWSLLYSDGSVFPLSNYDYEFSYRTNRGHKIVTDTSVISVEENILTWTFKSDEQVVSGRYTLCLKITLSGSKVIELQYDNAFMISPLSGFKGAGSEIVIQSYCDAIDLKDAVLQARKAMDLAADAVKDTANSAADAKTAKEAAEITAAQAKADATSAMAMAMDASGKVAVAEQAATDASRDAAAAQQAAQTVSDHITSLEQAISELPDGQAVSEKVAEHTTKLSELESEIEHTLVNYIGEADSPFSLGAKPGDVYTRTTDNTLRRTLTISSEGYSTEAFTPNENTLFYYKGLFGRWNNGFERINDAEFAQLESKVTQLESNIVKYLGHLDNPTQVPGAKAGDAYVRNSDNTLRRILKISSEGYFTEAFIETEKTIFVYNGKKGQIINGEFQQYLLEEDLVPVKENLSILLNETFEYKETNLPHIYEYDKAIRNAVLFGDIGSYIVSSSASRIFRIDVSNIISVTYPVFKSSANYGNAFTDSEGRVLLFISETTLQTGTYKTIDVPQGAKYFFVDITESIVSVLPDWMITCNKIGLQEKFDEINDTLFPQVKQGPFQAYGNVGSNIQFGSNAEFSHIYVTKNCEVETTSGEYPFSSFVQFVNANNVITRRIGEGLSRLEKHSFLVELQDDEKGAYISGIANSISLKSYDGIIKDTYSLKKEVAKLVNKNVYANNEDNNLVLCAIKTAILNSKIPFHAGYLFHKWSGNELYYGEDYGHIYAIGEAGFSPANKVMAMSPKDGTVIATFANQRGSLYVFDGKNTTELFANSSLKPMGWLYNSGVDFVIGSDGIERCIFAEYTNWPERYATAEGYNVWVGKYPYTHESDWKVVFNQKYGNNPATDITHFHQVRRDPWTDILYLTSGDASALSKWWYSTDKGETWVKLADGVSSGWESSICRCINFLFTKDNIYFATDNNENHCLNKIARGSNGVIDISSRVKICDLNNRTATNSICYVENPNGIFFFDRQSEHNTEFSDELEVMFYSLTENELVKLLSLHYVTPQWGGHRGKCYTNYMNSVETMPAMGFALDSKCIFDIISKDYANIGTIAYDICGKWSKVKSIVD